MLVLVYDEHGGFFDHVPPPPAATVSDDLPIATLGVRVPAVVVSPWVRQAGVFGHAAGAGHPRALVFDHTSILKTIVRRFLGAAPPFMGARYAEASDLSAVMLAAPRTPQFRPFIPYTLQFAASGLLLDVQSGDRSPGVPLVQSPRSGAPEQDFCFEDAGEDLVYLRSRLSGLYLTNRFARLAAGGRPGREVRRRAEPAARPAPGAPAVAGHPGGHLGAHRSRPRDRQPGPPRTAPAARRGRPGRLTRRPRPALGRDPRRPYPLEGEQPAAARRGDHAPLSGPAVSRWRR
jgi:hypothetical protein